MNDKLIQIEQAIEAEKAKVYFLHNSEKPDLELQIIINRIQALMALKTDILFKAI